MKKISICFIILFNTFYQFVNAGQVTINFYALIPTNTPDIYKIHIVGDNIEIGNWIHSDKTVLKRAHKGFYHKAISVEKGTKLTYKYTLGDWSRVEKDRFGFEIENRTITAGKDMDVQDEIYNWSEGAVNEKRIAGNILRDNYFFCETLNETIAVSIYLPPEYNDTKDAKYPVLYVIGGDNAFYTVSESPDYLDEWQFDEISEILIKSSKCKKFIIVSINNLQKQEYFFENKKIENPSNIYINFIISSIKKYIDNKFSTLSDKSNNVIFGAGMFAAMALNSISELSRSFSNFAFLSPELSSNGKMIFQTLNSLGQNLDNSAKCWWDASSSGYFEKNSIQKYLESSDDSRKALEILKEKKIFDEKSLKYSEIDGDFHNISAWSRRLDRILLYFFKK